MIGNSINKSVQAITINSNLIASTSYSVKLKHIGFFKTFFIFFNSYELMKPTSTYFICEFYPHSCQQSGHSSWNVKFVLICQVHTDFTLHCFFVFDNWTLILFMSPLLCLSIYVCLQAGHSWMKWMRHIELTQITWSVYEEESVYTIKSDIKFSDVLWKLI